MLLISACSKYLAWKGLSFGAFRRLVLVCYLGSATATAVAEPAPIVFGQSLPLRGAGSPSASANRVLQATQAYVAHVNRLGGIGGRKVEIVTLDDEGDAALEQSNLRRLAEVHKAVALLNCLGDAPCERASVAANDYGIPLIGPMSGSAVLRRPERRFTVALRADYAVQVEALSRQLQSIGATRLILLTSSASANELRSRLEKTFSQEPRQLLTIVVDQATPQSFGEAARKIRAANAHAVIVDLNHDALRILGSMEAEQKFAWPSMLATVSAGTLTQMTKEIRSRAIGYINVAPNPEDLRLPLVRELQAQAEQDGGPEAVTFEGVEAYVNLRFAVEAVRRINGPVTPSGLLRSARAISELEVGGFVLRLNHGRGGPSWVDVGLRSRDGAFVR